MKRTGVQKKKLKDGSRMREIRIKNRQAQGREARGADDFGISVEDLQDMTNGLGKRYLGRRVMISVANNNIQSHDCPSSGALRKQNGREPRNHGGQSPFQCKLHGLLLTELAALCTMNVYMMCTSIFPFDPLGDNYLQQIGNVVS